MGNTTNTQHKALLALDFQAALQRIEEQLRDCEDSEAIINRLLKGAAEFYGAARASIAEADRDLKISLLNSLRFSPKNTRRYFGENTMWYLQFHFVCANLL